MQFAKAAPAALLGLVLVLGGAGAATAQGLPGGATSLNETHGDWTVACVAPEATVTCVVSQVQVNNESRQRVLSVELQAAEGGNTAAGTLVMPFGLALERGVLLAIDESEPLPPLRFSTCLPTGCLVPLVFNQGAVTALRAGTVLGARAVANAGGQEVNFTISLRGFPSALARAAELAGA